LQARIHFEKIMEKQAMLNAVPPPAELKQSVMSALQPGPPVIPLEEQAPARGLSWLKVAAAVFAVLFAGSLFWNITQYNRNKKLQATYNDLVKDYDTTVVRLAEIEDEIAMLRLNPNIKMAAMKGMPVSPGSFATVYWDTTSKDVYLVVNNLPKPGSNKQYQLWALLDGKPVDMGMIDNSYFIRQSRLLLRMKNTSGAQAFAITLEKEGGVPVPEGDMYVMGSL
jgi:hypothetical protein